MFYLPLDRGRFHLNFIIGIYRISKNHTLLFSIPWDRGEFHLNFIFGI